MSQYVPSDFDQILGGLGVIVATLGLALAAGTWGIVAGLAIALTWALGPSMYAFAIGQLFAVAVLSGEARLVAIAVAEGGLLAMLAAPLTKTAESTRTVATYAIATLALGGIGWGVLRTGRPAWAAAVAITVVAALAAYSVHRYELVRLGLVTDDTPPEDRMQSGEGH